MVNLITAYVSANNSEHFCVCTRMDGVLSDLDIAIIVFVQYEAHATVRTDISKGITQINI